MKVEIWLSFNDFLFTLTTERDVIPRVGEQFSVSILDDTWELTVEAVVHHLPHPDSPQSRPVSIELEDADAGVKLLKIGEALMMAGWEIYDHWPPKDTAPAPPKEKA